MSSDKHPTADEDKHIRMGPSPTVCRVLAKFWERIGDTAQAEEWRKAAELPRSEGNA